MKEEKIHMSKRIMVTIPDSLYKQLKSMGLNHESDSELIRIALEILLYDRLKKGKK